MDLIQTAATVALLSLLAYFIIVNVLERSNVVHTEGKISEYSGTDNEEMITNRLASWATAGVDTAVGKHARTGLDNEPAPPGGENVTQLAVYNEDAKGVLPQNHDLFEKPADFGSDVTNINQFYRNNPEIFERSLTSAPDAADWHQQSQDMFQAMQNVPRSNQINAWNFERDPLVGTTGASLN